MCAPNQCSPLETPSQPLLEYENRSPLSVISERERVRNNSSPALLIFSQREKKTIDGAKQLDRIVLLYTRYVSQNTGTERLNHQDYVLPGALSL